MFSGLLELEILVAAFANHIRVPEGNIVVEGANIFNIEILIKIHFIILMSFYCNTYVKYAKEKWDNMSYMRI